MKKGDDLVFYLCGIFSAPETVENIHVNVVWNGSNLYDEDHPDKNTYDS